MVVGVGAIGRQVALQLAAIGMKHMFIYDHDKVAIENLATQGYREADIGRSKVEVTWADCSALNTGLRGFPIADRFRRTSVKDLADQERVAAFMCVDSIETRANLWRALRMNAAFYTDGRMSAEMLRVLTASKPDVDSYYETTLFAGEEAQQGSCTAKSTIYSANIAAGLMVGQFAKWLRNLPVERDIALNLLAMELAVT